MSAACRITALLLLSFVDVPDAIGATFVVNNRFDAGTGGCTVSECTLREAIVAANATPAADAITFDFPVAAGAEILIQPVQRLPTITQPLAIDGYSASGTSVNTIDTGASNAVLRIRLDGNLGSVDKGLSICANDVVVSGLSITGFASVGIVAGLQEGGAPCASAHSNVRIVGNFIGLRANGSTVAGNADGIVVQNTAAAIGSSEDAARNVVAGNSGTGIRIVGSTSAGSAVHNNLVGTNRAGAPAGNAARGVELSAGAEDVDIGLNAARNLIAFNGSGIVVANTAGSGISMFANEFRRNAALGIDIGPGSVTPNDADDLDTGANDLQNFPVVLSATRGETGISTTMSLDVGHAGAQVYRIALYASPACDPSGHGEGEFLLSQQTRTLSASSETFALNALTGTLPPGALPPGTVLTATATNPAGSTSEFSPCFELDPPALVVNTTADAGDGLCNADACTLREAIEAANSRAPGSASVISFAIPGPGPHVITPLTALPALRRAITIDGYTQAGAVQNTLAEGNDAAIAIEISSSANPRLAGLRVCAPDITLRGLAVAGFRNTIGTSIPAECPTQPLRLVLEGNFIGLRADGSTLVSEGDLVLLEAPAPGSRIGGTQPAQRNVISGSIGGSGIAIAGAGSGDIEILGNFIGTDPGGQQPRPNSQQGIDVRNGAHDIVIGGAAPGAANRIAFNGSSVLFDSGIQVTGAGTRAITFFGNDFIANVGLGADLGSIGVTANDGDDGDVGPNDLQNHPLLDSAVAGAGGLVVAGRLDVPAATAGVPYVIAIYESPACDGSGFGEGELLLGASEVVLSGNAEAFSLTLPGVDVPAAGTALTATATDPAGNTSEFSQCHVVGTPDDVLFADGFDP